MPLFATAKNKASIIDEKMNGSENDEESEDEEEEEKMSQGEVEVKSSDEEEGSEDDDNAEKDEHKRWKYIISAAFNKVSFGPNFTEPEQIVKEPYLSEMVDAMGTVVRTHLQFATEMEHIDDTYEQINKLIARYEFKHGYDTKEAHQTAWHDRRFLIREVLEKNLDTVAEKMKEDDSEDDTDDDDE